MRHPSAKNVPATMTPRSVPRPGTHAQWHARDSREPDDADFIEADFSDPPVETIIDPKQIKEKIIDYLGAVLARCWFDHDLLDRIAMDPHRALRDIGILLPPDIDVKVERENKARPRLVIYEWNAARSFRKRVCYLQLVMMAGA
jgi:hypothetical protein